MLQTVESKSLLGIAQEDRRSLHLSNSTARILLMLLRDPCVSWGSHFSQSTTTRSERFSSSKGKDAYATSHRKANGGRNVAEDIRSTDLCSEYYNVSDDYLIRTPPDRCHSEDNCVANAFTIDI